MNRFAKILLLSGLILPSQAICQTRTICIPRDQAARNADSLRALPLVRQMLAGTRQQLHGTRFQLNAAEARSTELSASLAHQINEAAQWKAKARRRGLIIGFGVGLPAAYGVYRILK